MKKLYPPFIAALFLLLSATVAYASIYGNHIWNSSNTPAVSAPNTWYNQAFSAPSPAMTAGVVHTVQVVGYSWNVYVCINMPNNPGMKIQEIPTSCQELIDPAGMGIAVELCRQTPAGALRCVPVSAKSGMTYDFYGETYTSSATKFFLRYKSSHSPTTVSPLTGVFVAAGAYVNVAFSAY